MSDESARAAYGTAPEPFTMATRMCDDDGMVSETVASDMQGLANQELRRLTYLDKVNNMRRHTGLRTVEPFACTGSAHLAGEHILCTSPAHKQLRMWSDEGYIEPDGTIIRTTGTAT